MATDLVSWVTSLLIGFLLSRDLIPKVSGWSENTDTETSSHRIHVVDNDPEFLVGAKGIEKPFCFHLESPENDVIRLLQDPISGIIVNARVFRDRHTNKTYLGTILVGGVDIRILAKQNDVIINDRKYEWVGMKNLDVRGHRVVVGADMVAVTFRKKMITLIVRRHFVAKEADDDYIDNETTEENSSEKETSGKDASDKKKVSVDSSSSDATATIRRRRRRRERRETKEDGDNSSHQKVSNPNNDNIKSLESSYSQTINQLSSTKNAEKNIIDFISNSKRTRHHAKRHTTTHRHRRKQRGRRFEKRNFQSEFDRKRRVSSYNDVIQSGQYVDQKEKTVYLGVYISDSRDFSNQTHGLLGQFLFKNVTLEKINYKNGRVKARFLIDDDPKRRTIALLSLRENIALNTTRACWRVRHQGMDVIDGGYKDYVIPSMHYTLMMRLPPPTPTPTTPPLYVPKPATKNQWKVIPTTTQFRLERTSLPPSSTTPAPPTYPTCVYETHHRVEPVGSKNGVNSNNINNNNPYIIATSNTNNNNNNMIGNTGNTFIKNKYGGSYNNNNNNNNKGNGWMVGVNKGGNGKLVGVSSNT